MLDWNDYLKEVMECIGEAGSLTPDKSSGLSTLSEEAKGITLRSAPIAVDAAFK